jgi:hypothetical protein
MTSKLSIHRRERVLYRMDAGRRQALVGRRLDDTAATKTFEKVALAARELIKHSLHRRLVDTYCDPTHAHR